MWFGVIFTRRGPYKNGVFRFSILLDENFPDCEHPVSCSTISLNLINYYKFQRVLFHSKVLHPVINPENNELNLLGAFPVWQKSEQHIWQVLKYIQWIFVNIDASIKHSVNKEASKL